MAYIYNLTDTWNDAAVTFSSIKMNVTDSASNAASLLMDLQVGNASRTTVTKGGALRVTTGTAAAPAISSIAATNIGFNFPNQFQIDFVTGGSLQARLDQGAVAFVLGPSWAQGWASSATLATVDLFLTRRAAANLRLGASDAAAPVAQTLSVQSVVAGTSNTAGANFTITGSQGTGTGAGGSIVFRVAPAGASGTAQNALVSTWQITSDGHLTLATDNTYDIGAVSTARPRNIYAGTSITGPHRLTGSAPASAAATGTAGDMRYDADYIYVCTATDTWKRVAIATWP